jgi:hypothetical protein
MSFSYTQKELFHPFSYDSGIRLSMGYQAEEAVKLHWGIPEEYFSTLF